MINPYSEDDFDDDDYHLGPFFDSDGEEIIPVGDEAVDIPLNRALGRFLVRSCIPELHNRLVHVSAKIMTEFIQFEWDRMWAGTPSQGFLFAYKGSAAAAGRLAEEVILREAFREVSLLGSAVERVLTCADAIEAGMLNGVLRGVRSDDLVLILSDERIGILESKSRYTKSRYLSRSKRKAVAQLGASLAVNPQVEFVAVALVDLERREIEIAVSERMMFLERGLEWPER